MRVLIVDDEAAARHRLSVMLDELDVEVVGEAENGIQALELAAERKPDLVLLDIAMPEVDGFDVGQRLPNPKPLIVFQTAYDEHALRAFDHEAIDYLVKPITMDHLKRAIDRARARTDRATPSSEVLSRLRSLLAAPDHPSRILARHRSGHILITLGEILQFRAESGVVYVRTAEREYLTDYTLTELEGRMGAAVVRPNRSELVCISSIRGIASNGDGSATLTLIDQTTVRVSRRRAADVRAQLDQ